MSNDITSNPLIIDTQAATAAVSSMLLISKIKWDAITTVDHIAQVKDKHGKIKWKHTATDIGTATNVFSPSPESDFNPPFKCAGLIVDDLDSGVLYIYLADPTGIPVSA